MIDDFLYNNPELYEKVFPQRGKSELIFRIFEKYLPNSPSSVLDIGCGTGRDLANLAKLYPNCIGIDVAPSMVTYAKKTYPGLQVYRGDMRNYRHNCTFDAICALGGCINFALSNKEIEATMATYRSHAHDGSLLILQPLNPCDYFGALKVPETFSLPYKGSNLTGIASYKLSKLHQVVERERTWKVEGQDGGFVESMKYRIIFPAEISYFLTQYGFDVLDIFEADGSAAYANLSMYVVARFAEK